MSESTSRQLAWPDESRPLGAARARVRRLVELAAFQNFILGVILVNAVTLGLETSATVMAAVGPWLLGFDRLALTIYVIEIALKLFAYGWRFFRGPWNVFDFTIVAVTLVPDQEGLAVLRALRILRAFRLISAIPSMRKVVVALFRAIPGMASVVALLGLVFYVAAVMATKLFAERFPDWFGSVGASLYSLFQIMTLESWSMGIVRPVMEAYPYAWAFFVPFILLTTFAVLNLFIAIIVNAMTEVTEPDEAQHRIDHDAVMAELKALRAELRELKGASRGSEHRGD